MCEFLKPWLQNLNEMHEKACLVSTRYCIYQGEGCSRKAALKMKLESNPHECDDHPEGSEIHQSGRTTNLDQEAVKTPLVGTGAPPRPKGNAMDGEAVPIRSSPHPRATWRSWGPHADRWAGSHVATAPCGPCQGHVRQGMIGRHARGPSPCALGDVTPSGRGRDPLVARAVSPPNMWRVLRCGCCQSRIFSCFSPGIGEC
jgi:hypothetical protein